MPGARRNGSSMPFRSAIARQYAGLPSLSYATDWIDWPSMTVWVRVVSVAWDVGFVPPKSGVAPSSAIVTSARSGVPSLLNSL